MNKHIPTTKECIVCQITYTTKSNSQLCCSKKCQNKRTTQLRLARHPKKIFDRICKICKTPFQTPTKRILCSKQCQYRNMLNSNNKGYERRFGKRGPKTSKKEESVPNALYVLNKELYKELVWCKAYGKRTPKLEKMFELIVNKLSFKFRYRDEEDRSDIKQTALLRLLTMWHKFDEEKSTNAFAYITEIVKRAYAMGWNELRGYGKGFKRGVTVFSIDGENLFNI